MTGTLRANALALAGTHGIRSSSLAQQTGEPVMRCANVLHILASEGLLVRSGASYFRTEQGKLIPKPKSQEPSRALTDDQKRQQAEDNIFRSLRLDMKRDGLKTSFVEPTSDFPTWE